MGGAEFAAVIQDMSEFFGEIRESVPMFAEGADQPVEFMQELGGFAVVASDFDDDGNLVREATLYSARRQNLNLKDAGPPSGYTRHELSGNVRR